MAKYSFTCDMGHDQPMVMEVEADYDELAMTEMMEKAKAHLAEMPHEGMEPMSDEEMMAMIKEKWSKTEDAADGGMAA